MSARVRPGLALLGSLLAHAALLLLFRPVALPVPPPPLQVELLPPAEAGSGSRAGAGKTVHAAGRPSVHAESGRPPAPHATLAITPSPQHAVPLPVTPSGTASLHPESPAPSTAASGNGGPAAGPGEGGARLTPARFLGNASRPEYPEEARAQGVQGRVELKVRVGRDGQVKEVLLLRSSGSAVLDRAAQALLRRGPFAPATRGGDPIESWLRIAVPYSLQ